VTQASRTTLIIDGLPADTWQVRSAEATEALFEPTDVVVRAWSTDPVDLDAAIGKDATLETDFDGEIRAFHGVVVDAGELAVRADRYEAEIVFSSKLRLLQLGRDHRIFQELSVQDVVSDVLSRAGVDGICQWQTNTTYEPHVNIVQYGESDYDLMARLLFEEGIGFVVEQEETAEKVVFFDDDTVWQVVDGESLLELLTTRAESRHGIHRFSLTHRVASDQVMQNDYDLENPGTDLRTEAATEDTTSREVYQHPGSYIDPGRGQRLTDRLLERLRASTVVGRGEGNLTTFAPGRFFSLSGATGPELDGDYVLRGVRHRWAGDEGDWAGSSGTALTYTNEFEVIPVDVPFRPEAAPEAPVIGGVQHALVTVPSGEEIHADENGRVKVRFLWDRSGITDDKSSTWLRVGQLALGGSMILPRIDFEVLVSFELGDLDRPVVSGHLYNAELPPPYELPGGATVSSLQTATTEGGPGANELRFEDAAGSEEIFINASKDTTVSVDDSMTWNVGNNQTTDIGSNNTLSVTSDHQATVGANRTLDIGGNQDVNVGAAYGSGVGGSLTHSIGGMRMVKVGGDHSESVNGSLTRTVGSLQSITGIAGVQRDIKADSTTTVGAAWAEVAGAARGLKVVGSYSETIGALKFIKAKNVVVNCDAAYTMNAAAEIVKAGGGRTDEAKGAVALTAGGAFKVKAKNINFEAKSKLVFRGGGAVIELTKAGMVKIKAPSITVKNAKTLNQIMHKSN